MFDGATSPLPPPPPPPEGASPADNGGGGGGGGGRNGDGARPPGEGGRATEAEAEYSGCSPLPSKWAVTAAASFVHAMHATCVYMAPATLLSPMRASLGLTVAEITQPLIAYRTVQAVFLIPAGFVLDAIGPQLSLRCAITAAALLAPLLPLMTSLPHLIILQTLLGVTKLFGGLSALLLVTNQYFPDGRGFGTATSLLLSGFSFAGFLAPAVIGAVSATFGWQAAFHLLSAIFIVTAIPLTFHYLREPDVAMVQRRAGARGGHVRNFARNLRNALNLSKKPHLDASKAEDAGAGVYADSAPLLAEDKSIGTVGTVAPQPPLSGKAGPARSRSASALRRLSRTLPLGEQRADSSGGDSARVGMADMVTGTGTSKRTGVVKTKGGPSRDSESQAEAAEAAAAAAEKEPLFTPAFLAIAAAVGTFSFSMHIMFDHLLVFLSEDFGMPFERATFFMSALNLVALGGKLMVGPLADRYNKALLIVVFSTLACVASFLLLDFSGTTFTVTRSLTKVAAFVLFYSVGYAAVFSLTTSVMPEFGPRKLGVRSNFNLMVLFGTGSVGSLLAGMARSASGSYKWPFMWNAIAFALCAIAGLVKYVCYDRKGGEEGVTGK